MKLTERKIDGTDGMQIDICPNEIESVNKHNGITYIKPYLGIETAVQEDAIEIMMHIAVWGFNHHE